MNEVLKQLNQNDSSLLNFLFDEQYYRTKNKDLESIEMDYIAHYFSFGWKEGRNPSSRFSTNLYLENNRDVLESGLCPLWHFVKFGVLEGRDIYAVPNDNLDSSEIDIKTLKELSLNNKIANYLRENKLVNFLFDRDYYIENNRDVKDSGIEPFDHYFNYGWREGRNPNKYICVKSYLSQEQAEMEIEPICHYIYFGKDSGLQLFKSGTIEPSNEIYKEMMSVHKADVKKAEFSPKFNTPLVKSSPVKTIAMYLPQFHPFKQNDDWWGKGFTEWRNVAKAVPQFEGHYQPRLPGELGYYDLRLKETFEAQISLAQEHGVDAFCFHYYWFGGTRLMEKPLTLFLENNDLNIDFCLCWANENWTRRWDGSENDVLIAQQHSEEDNVAVFNDLLQYFNDDRYIKVDGKPLIVVYRPAIIPDISTMIKTWRKLACEKGFTGLHVLCTNAFGFNDYSQMGFDGIVEFPPHDVEAGVINNKLSFYNEDFSGFVYEYSDVTQFCQERLQRLEQENKGGSYFPTVMTSWDNSARKPGKGNVFHNASPQKFHDWFKFTYDWSVRNHSSSSAFVFINAWNEWAEGTYLEPDLSYGYAYLNAIRTAVNEHSFSRLESINVLHKHKPTSKKAIFAHIYYEDMVDEIVDVIEKTKKKDCFDVVLTIPRGRSIKFQAAVNEKLKPNVLIEVENRGRDVFPFLAAILECKDLEYEVGLKIHSKKSKHLKNGNEWKRSIFDSLTNEDALSLVKELSIAKSKLGIVCPEDSIQILNEDSLFYNKENMKNIVSEVLNIDGHIEFANRKFVAGTMFWFNVKFIEELVANISLDTIFSPELGAIDGTNAHAFERLFLLLAEELNYEISTYKVDDYYYPY